MSTTYVGVNTYHAQVTIPQDGDPAIAESVNTSIRDLLDNTVNNNTNLGFKIDTRGTTAGLTGDIALSGAGRTIQLGTETTILGINPMAGYDSTVRIVAPEVTFEHDLPFASQQTSFKGSSSSVYLTTAETFIGTGADQQLTVGAEATFNGDVEFTNDVTIGDGTSDTLTVNGPGNFNSNVDVDGTLTVDSTFRANGASLLVGNVDVQGALNASGSVTLGNASSDAIQINGAITAEAEATFEEDVLVRANVQLGSSSSHTVTVNAAFVTERDTTIGNSSSDELTVNAELVAPLVCQAGSAGRVPGTISGTVTSNTTITPADGQLILINMASPASNRLIIDETGAVNGDEFWLCNRGTASYVLQLPNGNTHTVASTQNVHMHFRDTFWYVAAYNTAFIDIG